MNYVIYIHVTQNKHLSNVILSLFGFQQLIEQMINL